MLRDMSVSFAVAATGFLQIGTVQDPDFETEGSVIACLQDFRNMLMETKCQEQVHKMMALASEDIRFNQILSDACLSDRERFCKDTQQVTNCVCGEVNIAPAAFALPCMLLTCCERSCNVLLVLYSVKCASTHNPCHHRAPVSQVRSLACSSCNLRTRVVSNVDIDIPVIMTLD